MADEPVATEDELRAALAARRELGSEREPEVVDAFLDRIERSLEERAARRPARRDWGGAEQRRFVLAVLSVLAGIPLTAIALGASELPALLVVWAGIVLVNLAYARGR